MNNVQFKENDVSYLDEMKRIKYKKTFSNNKIENDQQFLINTLINKRNTDDGLPTDIHQLESYLGTMVDLEHKQFYSNIMPSNKPINIIDNQIKDNNYIKTYDLSGKNTLVMPLNIKIQTNTN